MVLAGRHIGCSLVFDYGLGRASIFGISAYIPLLDIYICHGRAQTNGYVPILEVSVPGSSPVGALSVALFQGIKDGGQSGGLSDRGCGGQNQDGGQNG